MQIEPYDPSYPDAIIHLSLRAWVSVFDSIQNVMDADVYQVFYPESWRVNQQSDLPSSIVCNQIISLSRKCTSQKLSILPVSRKIDSYIYFNRSS